MKKLIKEWKKFITESYSKNIDIELDLSTDSTILYHTGWKSPEKSFETDQKFVFTGEPEIFKDMERPMGNSALYFASSQKGALGYSRFSDLPYLYKVRFPISKIAGGHINDPLGITKRSNFNIPIEEAEYFFKKAAANWKTDYKAKFQIIKGGLEVAVYDASLIEILSWKRLFSDDDVAKWFDENIRTSMQDYFEVEKMSDGKYRWAPDPDKDYGDPEIMEKDVLMGYFIEDFENIFVSTTHLPLKKKAALEEFKKIFPTEYESYKKSLLDLLASIKAGK